MHAYLHTPVMVEASMRSSVSGNMVNWSRTNFSNPDCRIYKLQIFVKSQKDRNVKHRTIVKTPQKFVFEYLSCFQ